MKKIQLLFLVLLFAALISGCVPSAEKVSNPKANEPHIETLLSSKDIPLTIVTTNGAQQEMVVYAELPSTEKVLERKFSVLKIVNQIKRENQKVQLLSIWDNEQVAKEYVSNYPQTSNLSWKGLDHRVAIASIDSNETNVSYSVGRDEFVDISFGMANYK